MTDVDAIVVGAGFSGLYMLHRLRELGLYADNITATDMKHLSGLTNLRALDISHSVEAASAETLQPLANLKKLEYLDLSSCGLTDDARWASRHGHRDTPQRSGWPTVAGVVVAVALGATVTMATIAFTAQQYFESTVAPRR